MAEVPDCAPSGVSSALRFAHVTTVHEGRALSPSHNERSLTAANKICGFALLFLYSAFTCVSFTKRPSLLSRPAQFDKCSELHVQAWVFIKSSRPALGS